MPHPRARRPSRSGAAWLVGEGRQKQDSPRLEGGAAIGRNPHRVDGASGTDDEGLPAPQQDLQAFLFDRRVKPADHRHVLVAQTPRGVVGAQDGLARRARRAEEGGLAVVEESDRTDRRQRRWRAFSQPRAQDGRIQAIASSNALRAARLFCFFMQWPSLSVFFKETTARAPDGSRPRAWRSPYCAPAVWTGRTCTAWPIPPPFLLRCPYGT